MPAPIDILVFSKPVAGREGAYNQWYDQVHLPQVIASRPEFVGGRRYRLTPDRADSPQGPAYLAVYNARTDDPTALMAALSAMARSGELTMSDALDHASIQIRFATPQPPERTLLTQDATLSSLIEQLRAAAQAGAVTDTAMAQELNHILEILVANGAVQAPDSAEDLVVQEATPGR